MTLSDLTQQIVENRKQSRKLFADREKELLKMQTMTKTIQQNTNSGLWGKIIESTQTEDLWEKTVDAEKKFSIRLNDFLSETGLFYQAKARADREYVNVGSVGVTQEGKSEFNAKIANLNKCILPRGGGNYSCTTARINIINGVSPEGNKDIVRVHYYTVPEFACLIHSYLVELGADKNDYIDLLSIETKTQLETWIATNKRDIEESGRIGKDEKMGKKTALLEYFKNFPEYKDRLGNTTRDYTFDELTSGSERDKNRAEEYYSSVSYFLNPDNKKDKRFSSFATKKAEVFSSFRIGNEEPISNLQFLDTPGIGESKPGLERILAKSVSSDLDIIIAIRAARSDVQTDTVRTMLITQLRTLLNKRPQAQQSLYFILNFWDSAKDGTGEDEKNEIIKDLKVPQNLDKIVLDDSHFRTINILKNEEVLPNGDRKSHYPIHNYLFEIFNQLIPKIQNIDAEYFQDAENEFKGINEDYKNLIELISALSNKLPIDDLHKQIDSVLKKVEQELENTWNNQSDDVIVRQIKCSLEEFCTQKTGIVLSKLLGVKKEDGIAQFDEANNNQDFIDDFCKKNIDVINKKVDKLSWNEGNELQCYANLKSEFLDYIKEEILSHIDVKKAQEELVSLKKIIANVFRTDGKLSFVSDDESWWVNMVDILEKEKSPKELTDLFKGFAEFSIDYRKILKESIDEVIRESRHADNFGNPTAYFFSSWENAKRSIVHSLLCIESRVQSLVEEDVYKKELEKVASSVSDYVGRFQRLNTYDLKEKSVLRESWEDFYHIHAKQIFKDNEVEKKRALISEWNKLCE